MGTWRVPCIIERLGEYYSLGYKTATLSTNRITFAEDIYCNWRERI